MSELKPCPFCGGEVEMIFPLCSDMSDYIRHSGPEQCPVEFSAFAADGDLVEAWNTRAMADPDTLRLALERIATSNIGDPNTLHPSMCAQIAREALTAHIKEEGKCLREAALDRMVDAWMAADAHPEVRETCRALLDAALAANNEVRDAE